MTSAELAATLAKSGQMAEIYRSLEPAWPHEGCGFVFEFPERGIEVLPTKNRAQELHERFPDEYPRGAEDWFEPDMKPWLRAQREDGVPQIIFHSHPDVGAYFSDSDIAMALSKDEDGNTVERNPGVRHLVVSVKKGNADGAKMFEWNAAQGRFDEVAAFDATGALID